MILLRCSGFDNPHCTSRGTRK